ncbi:MAG TPA: beta-galactosidase domain 4-containing protein, partial [Actinopolymorphaceae bacterium]
NDGNFVCDGLFWPDRTPHPAMWEAKRLFQPFDAAVVDQKLRIHNKYDVRDLAHLEIRWKVSVDGTVVESGVLPTLSTGPGVVESIDVPWSTPALTQGQEAFALLTFHDETGHEVGWTQHAIGSTEAGTASPDLTSTAPAPEGVTVTESDDGWSIRGERFSVDVRRSDGALTSWQVDGEQLLTAGPSPTVWRAPTDNDGIQTLKVSWQADHQAMFRWKAAGLDRLTAHPTEVAVTDDGKGRAIVSRSVRYVPEDAQAGYTHRERLVVASDGTIDATHEFVIDEGLPDLARVGVVATVPAGFERLEWFGRGPHESYVDRKAGAAIDRWGGTVDAQYVPYIFPQEHGNKTDLRWLSLRREDGVGLLVSAVGGATEGGGDGLLQGKASHYSDEVLTKATHTVELERSEEVFLAIDARQRGLGGASCGPDTLERYRIPSGTTYTLRYRLLPLAPDDDPAVLHRS